MIGTDFESLVGSIPVDKNSLISSAISWFLRRQEPDDVTFQVYKNGYAIEVKTDEDNIKEAAEFWKDNVIPKLEGEEEQ